MRVHRLVQVKVSVRLVPILAAFAAFCVFLICVTATRTSANWGGPEGNYIIITHPDFESALMPLVNHRSSTGYSVVLRTSDWIKDNYQHDEGDEHLSIYDYIYEAYHDWSTKPEYVLLVGDSTIDGSYENGHRLPFFRADCDDYLISDDLFVCVKDGDFVPDIAIGRLPARTATEVTNYINKLVYYETQAGGSWEYDCLFAVNDKTPPQNPTDDYEEILYGQSDEAEGILTSGGLNFSEIRSDSEPDPYSAYFSAINSGKSLALVNGTAARASFFNFIFSTGDLYPVEDLNNIYKYPIFLNPTCDTGMFEGGEPPESPLAYDDICESLIFAHEKGGVGAFGCVTYGYVLEHWECVKAILERLVRGCNNTIGEEIESAKFALIRDYPYLQKKSLAYHYFGDPALVPNIPSDYYPPYLARWPIYQDHPVGNPTVSVELPLAWEDPIPPPPENVVGGDPNDSPLNGGWAENATPVLLAPSEGFAKAYYSSTQEVFDLYTSGGSPFQPVTADVDADGEMDTVLLTDVGSSCLICLLDEDGIYKPGFPVSLNDSCDYPPALGDIDADGYLDIIVATDTKLHAIDHEGNKQVLANFNDIYQGNLAAGSPAIGDINQDGYLEIVMSLHLYPQEYSYLVVYENDGDIADGWPVMLPTELITAPALADLNGDPGDIEIVVGSINNPSGGGPNDRVDPTWDNGQCRIFEYDGSFITSGPTTATRYELPPVVADVLGVPTPEILLVNEQYGARVNVYNSDCVLIDEFSYGGTPTSPPTVADVDGDGLNEVIMGTNGKLKNIHDPGISAQWNCPLYGDVSAPAVCDLDDDGSVDIVCGDDEAVYAFTTDASYDSDHLNEEWSKSGHDNMNTGLWDLLAPTNVKAEDVPDDEGGAIKVWWTPSLDAGIRSTRAQGYQVWRTSWEDVPPPPGPPGETGGDVMVNTVSPVTAGRSVKTENRSENGGRNGVWEWIDSTSSSTYVDDTVENYTEGNLVHYAYKLVTGDNAYAPPPPGGEGNTIIGGHLSQPSITATAEAHDNTPPAPPTDLDGYLVNNGPPTYDWDVYLNWELSINDKWYWERGPLAVSGTDTVARITLPRDEWGSPSVTTGGGAVPSVAPNPESAKKMEGLKSSTGKSGAVATAGYSGITSGEDGVKLKGKTEAVTSKGDEVIIITPSGPASVSLPGDSVSNVPVNPVTKDPGKTTFREEPPEALDVQEYRVKVVYESPGYSEVYTRYAGPEGTKTAIVGGIPDDELEYYTFHVLCKDAENTSDDSNPYPDGGPLGNQTGILAAGDGSTFVVAGSDTGISAYEKPTAYPNPFTESVTIGWPLAEADEPPEADVVIYDIAGRKVKSFSNVSDCHVLWGGVDDNGNAVPGGVYIVNVTVDGETFAYKVMRK
jgi:hypothetical protein